MHRAPALIFLVVLVECCIGQPGDGAPRCKPRLTAVKEIRTAGSAGWEFWEHAGEHFLATANFWVCTYHPAFIHTTHGWAWLCRCAITVPLCV